MQIFSAQLINSIALGSIYALLATGFNLMLIVGGVFQFAYPSLVVMSMYVCWLVLQRTGGNLFLSILAAIGSSVGMSLATEPIFRLLVKRWAVMATLLVSLAMAMIVTDIMSRFLNEGLPIAFPPSLSSKEALVGYGVATISTGQLATIIGSFTAVSVFFYLLYQTKQGRAFRAMAQNPFAARLLGIPIARTGTYSYALAGLLGGISALFLAMSLGTASSVLADNLVIKVMAVALLAGLGNLKGGLVAALILGLAESMTLAYLPGDWSNAIAFGIVIVVAMIKPQGLFGTRT